MGGSFCMSTCWGGFVSKSWTLFHGIRVPSLVDSEFVARICFSIPHNRFSMTHMLVFLKHFWWHTCQYSSITFGNIDDLGLCVLDLASGHWFLRQFQCPGQFAKSSWRNWCWLLKILTCISQMEHCNGYNRENWKNKMSGEHLLLVICLSFNVFNVIRGLQYSKF